MDSWHAQAHSNTHSACSYMHRRLHASALERRFQHAFVSHLTLAVWTYREKQENKGGGEEMKDESACFSIKICVCGCIYVNVVSLYTYMTSSDVSGNSFSLDLLFN